MASDCRGGTGTAPARSRSGLVGVAARRPVNIPAKRESAELRGRDVFYAAAAAEVGGSVKAEVVGAGGGGDGDAGGEDR